MQQTTLAQQAEFQRYWKKTRREQFLDEMEAVMPWAELLALIEPHYPKGENGRPPVGLGIMLRVYFLQHWFNLSDPAVEDALYESPVLRRFAGIGLGILTRQDSVERARIFSGHASPQVISQWSI